MRFLLLNQFGSASEAPTGRILAELGAELKQRGHQVHLIVSDAKYGKPRRGLKRIFAEGLSHVILLGQSLFCSKADAVISLTSPACLPVTAGIVAKLHRAHHFHWVMDLYPDVGVRLGELPRGPLIHLLSSLMRWAYREAEGVVSLDEDMRDYLRNSYGIESMIVEPFPPEVTWPVTGPSPGLPRQWLYSGNFGRAHEIQVLLEIQKKLEDQRVNARLILQGQGPQFLSSRHAADQLGLRQVEWKPFLPLPAFAEALLQSDVVVVTRKAEMKGLLLPSKLILAELSGRTILWIGDTDGKTAQRLSREGRHGVFAIEDAEKIAGWLQILFEQKCPAPVVKPRPTNLIRQQSLRQWETILQQ